MENRRNSQREWKISTDNKSAVCHVKTNTEYNFVNNERAMLLSGLIQLREDENISLRQLFLRDEFGHDIRYLVSRGENSMKVFFNRFRFIIAARINGCFAGKAAVLTLAAAANAKLRRFAHATPQSNSNDIQNTPRYRSR